MHISLTAVEANSLSRIEGAFLHKYFLNYKEPSKGVHIFFFLWTVVMSARECISYVYSDILVQFTILQHPWMSRINHIYSAENNTCLFWFKLCLYMCATCYGLYLGHPQACQYKTLLKEDTIKSKGPLFTITIFIKLKGLFFVCFWRDSPHWARVSSYTRFLDHTKRQNEAPHSVGLLWTSDQLVAETSTRQHITHTTDNCPCLRWDANPQSQ